MPILLDTLVPGARYGRLEVSQLLASLGEPPLAPVGVCVNPRQPEDWCVLMVTQGHERYENKLKGGTLTMRGNDGDTARNLWLADADDGRRIGLLYRDSPNQPQFQYLGEVELGQHNALAPGVFFVWHLPPVSPPLDARVRILENGTADERRRLRSPAYALLKPVLRHAIDAKIGMIGSDGIPLL